jgi:hypothetical protein
MIRLKKINQHETKPMTSKKKVDTRPILGADLVPILYATILCLARKKLGKTQLNFDFIRHCIAPGSMVHAYVSTLHNDDTWTAIMEYCQENGIAFHGHTSLFDEEGHDQLARLVRVLNEEAEAKRLEEESEAGTGETKVLMCCDDPGPVNKRKPKLPSHQSPERVFIFDDLSDELKTRSFAKFLKNMRHYKCKVIIGTQDLHDLLPASRKMVDIWALFKGQSVEKLETIHKDADLSVPFETFEQLYRVATKEPYSFLYVNATNQTLRKKFSQQFELPPNK